jgi:DNA-binding NarL/FixJ family response regulator
MVAEAVPFKSRIPVHVSAADPLSRAGIVSQLRKAQGFHVVSDDDLPDDVVGLVVGDELDAEVVGAMRSLRGRGIRRVVLLVSRVDDRSLLAAAEAGATGVLRRSEATAGNLGAALRSAAAG